MHSAYRAKRVTKVTTPASLQNPLSPKPEQNLTLTDLIRPLQLTISSSIVPTADDGSFSTYLRIVQTDQIGSKKSERLHHRARLYRQKQNLTLTDLIRLTPLIASCTTALTFSDGTFATYLLKAQTEQIRYGESVRSHRSSSLYRPKQNITPADLVRPALLIISRSTVPTAADCFSAAYLCIKKTEQT